MKYIKRIFESQIEKKDFDSVKNGGNSLSKREQTLLYQIVDKKWFHACHPRSGRPGIDGQKKVEVYKEDNYYYSNVLGICNQFDSFNSLVNYLYLRYKMDQNDLTLDDVKNSILDPSFDNNLLISKSSELGYTEIVKYLLKDSRVDPRGPLNWAIRKSSSNGHLEIVKLLLLDGRANPGYLNNDAISWAASHGHTEVVRELLKDPRVDPSILRNGPILSASHTGNIEMMRILLKDPRVDPSVDNNYIIKCIPKNLNNYEDIVRLLIKHPKVRKGLSKEDIERYELI